ncbi:testis-expressed protein 9-like [Pararge aegeria]|uniref:Jg23035 protein n=2 Tax=Pararge aegeria TaxID=116150 RepID=A0A8S4SKY2_9NEOP|nr:testis-expressed protein 9-like [Pararge aegeria]CAH2269155.1 jg23035 [Pararge aegeria aegeria]
MDSEDLLARENEFKKLNKQLEKKTESLMKEIEHVMQRQDIFSEFNKLTLSPVHRNTKKHSCASSSKNTTPEKKCQTQLKNTKNHQQKVVVTNNTTNSNIDVFDRNCNESMNGYNSITNCKQDNINEYNSITNCSASQIANTRCNCECYILSDSNKRRNDDLEFLYAFVSVGVKDNVLPPSFMKDNLTVESVCKFLSAKVKLMQEQIDKLQMAIDKKAKQCDKHMTHLAELESERLTLLNRANSMRSGTADMKAKYAAIQNKLNEKDRLYKEQRSVTDKLTTELKQLKCKNASLEARCASQDESMSTLKHQLEAAKISEKDFRDSSRSLSATHQTTIQKLEARIKTLTLRTDRQTALIDNLKKQNALLQTDGALKALEKEYCEFLKQDFS